MLETVNWGAVADFAHDRMCDERRKYGRCNCKSRGKNPCFIAAQMEAAATAIMLEETSAIDPASIAKWVRSRTCGKSKSCQGCNHKGCIRAEEIVQWIEQRK